MKARLTWPLLVIATLYPPVLWHHCPVFRYGAGSKCARKVMAKRISPYLMPHLCALPVRFYQFCWIYVGGAWRYGGGLDANKF